MYTRTDRKVAMAKNGTNGASIARDLGVSEALVSLVISGKRTGGTNARRVMERLSEEWGVPIDYAFPGTTEHAA